MKRPGAYDAGLHSHQSSIGVISMANVADYQSTIYPPDLPLFMWAAQRHTASKPIFVSWRVNRWLGVDRLEVR